MKIKKDFVLRKVADTYVVLPLGLATVAFDGMMTLNESGAMLWGVLEQGGSKDDLINLLEREFGVSHETACQDVSEFLENINSVNCLED